MKNKVLKRILPCALAFTMLLSACDNKKSDGNFAKIGDVEFWSTYSTEKVLQNNIDAYAEIKKSAELNVSAVKGEEEAAQIIMTTKEKAVDSYDVTVGDLTSGDNTFSKDNVKVYHQKYVEITGADEYYIDQGFYPDCLVPFDGVKKVKENQIPANSNQGLYVSFDVPENQASGTYTGQITVTIGGENKSIPLSLTVVNAAIGAETHTKSIFLNEWYFYRGELDETEEMYDAYNKFLFDYRVGCNDVILASYDAEYYAERVCEYAKLKECPTYNIPYFAMNCKGGGVYLNGRELKGHHVYNPTLLKKYFKAIAYEGFKENVDPFAKAVIYGYDEPELNFVKYNNYTMDYVIECIDEWAYVVRQCKNNVIEELRADPSVNGHAMFDQIITSLDNVPHVVTQCTYLNLDLDLENEDFVYSPEFQFMSSEEAREKYRLSEDNELWWYGCTAPEYPYPTYHIDDTLLSARVLSWMQKDYDIQGNLYWSTSSYQSVINGQSTMPEDYYGGIVPTDGEGLLLYPGAKYGVYGPLPSMRLEQIRDGLEEYEMIYSMSEIYKTVAKEIGVDFDEKAVMFYLYDTMYSGTKVNTTSKNFEKQRALLLDLFELASSSSRVCVMDVKEIAGKYEFTVYSDNSDLKNKGEVITSKIAKGNGYVYTITSSLDSGDELDLSVTADGASCGVKFNLGDSAISYDAAYAYDNEIINRRSDKSTPVEVGELIDATTVNPNAAAGEKYLPISLGEAKDAAQDFLLIDKDVIKKLSAKDRKFVVRLYSTAEEEISASILLKYANGESGYSTYDNSIKIKPGENILIINNIDGFLWRRIKGIENIRIQIGSKGDAARSCIYFIDMSVYS
ncbi:MAG: DUF4091 domain-containing protein [Clostridiales bacterium]|nr:DUF4091 domain-containing protein [Clostridiales bacterium]MBE5754782.1 DUF4091 domain-containing protein [Clostridiales bacterium]